jgi:hypothetical protein
MSGAKGGKICAVCQEDCSTRQRTKDAQGRYYCQSCYDRAALAQQPRGTALDAGIGLSFLDAVEPTAAKARIVSCPTCGFALAGGSILCTNCGHRLDDPHQAVTTRVATVAESARRTRAVAASSRGERAHVWHIVIGMITLLCSGLLLTISLAGALAGDNPLREAGEEKPGYQTGFKVGMIFTVLIYGMPLVGSIGLMLKRIGAITLLRSWAWIMIGLHLICLAGLTLLALVGSTLSGEQDGAFLWLLLVAVAVSFLVSCGWPLFLLWWFRRPKIEADIGSWG